MTELRRLTPDKDERLIREAVAWAEGAPAWFRDCDRAWGEATTDAYLEQMRTDPQADFGVFDAGEFVAVLTVSLEGKGVYNSHLMARRGARPEVIAEAITALMRQMFAAGMIEAWLWTARKNYGVRRILEAVGMRRDGVERYKGTSHGRPILWLRYSVRRA